MKLKNSLKKLKSLAKYQEDCEKLSFKLSKWTLRQKDPDLKLAITSGGAGGNIQDARITFAEWEKINDTLFELLGGYCGKTADQVKNDASRDLWLGAEEALTYGIIDEIVKKKK